MAYDQDWFNRYDASQKFAKKIIVDQINHAENPKNVKKYLECFHTMLTDANVDPALKASSLKLPMFQSLNEAFETDANPL